MTPEQTKKFQEAVESGDWKLASEIAAKVAKSDRKKTAYEKKLDANLNRNKARHREATDIGDPDESTIDKRRKLEGSTSLQRFFEIYFPEVFFLGWSPDHLKVIEKLERAVINGELSAIAMPRGSGKTSCVIRAAMWAMLTGKRNYVALIAATESKAQALLRGIKTEMLHNDKLAEDYPAELHCVRSLENRAMMASGQHRDGTLTGIEWSVGKVCLGYIDHESCEKTNYGMIQCMGITGDIRGVQITLPTGQIRRPDLILVDDPQTKQPLCVETPVLTSDGWKTIGAVEVGDQVFGGDGELCDVLGKSPVYTDTKCYEIEFDNGEVIVADEDHKWVVSNSLQRGNKCKYQSSSYAPAFRRPSAKTGYESVLTTGQIFKGTSKDRPESYSVEMARDIKLGDQSEFSIDPYTLGAWLGDGSKDHGVITSEDPEILDEIAKAGEDVYETGEVSGNAKVYRISGVRTRLRSEGLLGNKHVPEKYMRSTRESRLSVVQGLMDTDGTARKDGRECRFTNSDASLIESFRMLCLSLGIKPRVRLHRKAGETTEWSSGYVSTLQSDSYRVCFCTDSGVFRLPRKRCRQDGKVSPRAKRWFIKSVREIDSVPVQCLEVSSPDHTFLVSRSMIRTHNSAGSVTQCKKRHETLLGDVLGLAGPGVSVAGMCTCTVVYANDLADRLLDREESPEWAGQRCKLVYEWPSSDEAVNLWDEYSIIYQECMRLDTGVEAANEFLRENYDVMHEGAVVGWEERYDKSKEISALQHAFNLKIRDEAAFAAEYQNEPQSETSQRPFDLNAETLAKRVVHGLGRGSSPEEVETVTAAIDVQKSVLFYSVIGWTPTSRGYIMDYGTYPNQGRNYFSKSEIPVTLQEAAGTDDLEGALRHGLTQLTTDLLTTDYDHAMVEKLVIDARWGESTEIIRRFCRESMYRSQIHPSMGIFIGANTRPWQKMKLNKRDKKGIHAKFSPPTNGRGRPELLVDVNWYKTMLARRLTISEGSSTSLVLFDAKPTEHRMFAEHLSSELPKVSVSKTGNTVTEWSQSRTRDNDWLDTVVYNSALASILGVGFIKDRKTHASEKDFDKASRKSHASDEPVAGQRETAKERMLRRRKR